MAKRKTLWEGEGILTHSSPLSERVYLLHLKAPEIASVSQPGNFVMVQPSPELVPFLHRPMGIAGVERDEIVLMVQVLGKGTALLGKIPPKTSVTLRGPLGKGYSPLSPQESCLLAAGGVGVVPLLYAYRQWKEEFHMDFVLGVPDKTWQGLVDYVKNYVPNLRVVSDDGSLGDKGNPCTCVKEESWDQVWACGPMGMLKAMAETLPTTTRYLPSMEARMGCGYGGCLGCTIPTVRGNLRCCVEGPVMEGGEVLWHELP